MMDVLLDRFIAESTFLTEIREKLRHLIHERLVWKASPTSTHEPWHQELQHLLNRSPQVRCDLFWGPFDDAATPVGAMHPRMNKRLHVAGQLRIVSRPLTPRKRPEIEEQRYTLGEISR